MEQRTITVRGKADLLVTPDFTEVLLNIQEEAQSYQKAQELLKSKAAEIVACVQAVGLSADCVRTTNYSAHVQKKSEKDWKGNLRQVDDGCVCRQTVIAGFPTDTAVLSKLVSIISERIVKPDMTIRFSIKDKKKFEAELLKKVTEDAQSKARIFCEPSGAKIGRLITVDYQQGRNLWSVLPVPRLPMRPINNDTTFLARAPQPLARSSDSTCVMSAPQPIMPPAVSSSGQTQDLAGINFGLTPEARQIEEEALFVWEIVDIE